MLKFFKKDIILVNNYNIKQRRLFNKFSKYIGISKIFNITQQALNINSMFKNYNKNVNTFSPDLFAANLTIIFQTEYFCSKFHPLYNIPPSISITTPYLPC